MHRQLAVACLAAALKNENLIALAKGSDILVHEVLDKSWATNLFPAQRSPDQEAKLGHLLRAHTPTEDIGPIAHAAEPSFSCKM